MWWCPHRLPRALLLGTAGSVLSLWLAACTIAVAAKPQSIAVGLVAPLSGSLAASGQAIQRGILLALDELNAEGGALGRPLALVTRDVPNDPPAGVAALRDLVEQAGVVAVFGGLFGEVMLAQLDLVHERQVPLVNAWGSISGITENGRSPNYAFRVAVTDDEADAFLARYALRVVGARRPGVLADTSPWGAANAAGLAAWLERLGRPAAAVERFDPDDTNMTRQLARLRAAGADALLLVANAPEGAAIVRGLATLGWRPPIVSHWGVSGGAFAERAGVENAEGVLTLQTYSFVGPQSPKGEAVLRAYHARFGTRRAAEVAAPVGVAHGYDGAHLLARAIRRAGTTAGPRVREALEHLAPYGGLVKRYAPAFTPERHDALLAEDYLMAVWRNGQLVPAPQPRLRS